MEEDIKQIFNKIYSDAENGDGPQEALEVLNSFNENPEFYQGLFTLFLDTSEEHPIRLLSIIELKRQLKLHWNGFSDEFQHAFLENVPNLVIGIPTQEPKYYLLISDLISTLLSLTFDTYFNIYWTNLIEKLIDSDPDYFFSGILILIDVFQIPNKTRYLTEFIPFFRQLFEKITIIYSEEELTPFLKSQCILAAISIVKNDPVICLEESFLPWYESVTSLTSSDSTFLLPFSKETAYYMSNLIELFRTCQIRYSDSKLSDSDEIPYTSELFYICFEIMFEPEWEDNSNLNLLVPNVFKFFGIFAERAMKTWKENFLPRFPEILQNVFLPVFTLTPDAYQLIMTNPMDFISEYHVDPESCRNFDNEIINFQTNDDDDDNNNNDNEEEEEEGQQIGVYYERNYGTENDFFITDYEDPDVPIVSAALCLKIICKYEEIHEFLFSIPSLTLTEFMSNENKDFLYLYSVFHMVHSYWDTIVLYHYEEAVKFMDQLLPLFQESIENPSSISSDKASIFLFQSSLLLIISRANPFISQKNEPAFEENYIKVNPAYVEVSIALLDSESLVVQYFASFSLHYLLYHYLSSEYDEDVMKVCLPHALKIIIKVIGYASEYGKTSTTHIISIFLKNKEILASVIEQTPDLIESIFDIALHLVEENSNYLYVSNELSTLFSTLTNAIDQFDSYPEEEEMLCTMIFRKCIDTFSVFQYFTSFYELLGIILGKSPNYDHESYNLIFQPIVSTLVLSRSRVKGFASEIALIFHNMMIRSPEFMLEMNCRSIQSIINDDGNLDSEVNSNSLFEIGLIIINNQNEDTTRNIYFSALINLIPPEEFPLDYLEEFILQDIEKTDELELSSSAVYNYDSFIDLFLIILKLNAKWFCERDEGRMLSIYFDLINAVDIGCALFFVDGLIPVETRNNYILEIINDPPQSLFDNYEEHSIDDAYYQMETNCVEQKHYYSRIFTNQQKLEIIQEYLQELAANDPDFMVVFNDKRQNLINLFEFHLE